MIYFKQNSAIVKPDSGFLVVGSLLSSKFEVRGSSLGHIEEDEGRLEVCGQA